MTTTNQDRQLISESIASTFYEEGGETTIVVPFRNSNGSITAEDITVDGTATEGEDYEIGAITEEGVSITFSMTLKQN